jgi:hypothetical protein
MSHRKTKRTFVKESASKSSTRKYVACDCNLCKDAQVDSRTRASHMKKREVTRGLIEPSDMGIGEDSRQKHISIDVSDDPIDPMDMDDIEIRDDSSGEQGFNFLVTNLKKSKRKRNISYPLVIIEKILSNRDEDQEVEDDDANFTEEEEDADDDDDDDDDDDLE